MPSGEPGIGGRQVFAVPNGSRRSFLFSSSLLGVGCQYIPVPFVVGIGADGIVVLDSAAIILAITIPRVPALSFNSGTPLVAATGDFNASIPTEFSRYPANFSFPAFADIQVDTTSNIIPLTFNHIAAQVWYPSTNMQIGTGYFGKATLPAKTFPVIQIPLNFSYIAPNDTDPTWLAWYNACKNPQTYTTGVRPGAFSLVYIIQPKVLTQAGKHRREL